MAAAREEKITTEQSEEVQDSGNAMNEKRVGSSIGLISTKPNGDAVHVSNHERVQETQDHELGQRDKKQAVDEVSKLTGQSKLFEGTDAENQHGALWKNINSDLGATQEWMREGERREAKKKSRKARSCAVVYKDAKVIQSRRRKKNHARSRKKIALNPEIPKFFPTSSNYVAGESLEDSNINNCNKGILAKEKLFGAKEIWEFAKSIGVVATE
ncbi:hypothetical protein SLE2022_379040 [Rubroshorea leprosula]